MTSAERRGRSMSPIKVIKETKKIKEDRKQSIKSYVDVNIALSAFLYTSLYRSKQSNYDALTVIRLLWLMREMTDVFCAVSPLPSAWAQ